MPEWNATALRLFDHLRRVVAWLTPRVLLALALLYLGYEARFTPIKAVYEAY